MMPNGKPILLLLLLLVLLMGCQDGPKETESAPTIPSTNAEPTLFTLMDPAETGLYFVNELKENEQLNILTYEYLYNGGGVAVGDVNNDGLPDVFFSGNLFGGRLYLNKGNLQFEQISEKAGVFFPGFSTGVSMVDINEDGYQDIYICRSLSDQPELRANLLLVNNGDATFTERAAEYGLADQSFSNHASFFDYDRDGDLDLYLLNHREDFANALTLPVRTLPDGTEVLVTDRSNNEYVTDRLYRNNGNGTFSDVTDAAGLRNHAFGLSATPADINNDGWTDLFVANDYADRDHLYINNGDGTFTDRIAEQLGHTSKNAMGSDIADYNNDGWLDLINLDMVAADNYRQKQLKGPGQYDLYHMAVGYGLGHQVMHNTLQLNNGDGSFSEVGQLAGISHTDWSWTPLLADLDNDGWKDLFITNGYYRDVTDMDYLKYGSNEVLQQAGGVSLAQAYDLVQSIASTPVANYAFANQGDLTFADHSAAWGLNNVAFSNGAVYADLDRDGDLDLLVNNLNSPAFLLRNNSRKQYPDHHFLAVELNGPAGNTLGLGARVIVETEGSTQLQECSGYRGYFSSMEPRLHFGLGTQEAATVVVTWPDGRSERQENVSANQTLLLEWANAQLPNENPEPFKPDPLLHPYVTRPMGSYLYKEDDFIDFKREPLLEHQLSNKGPFLAKGDVNGDGREDVYCSGAAGMAGELFVQTSSGTFVRASVPAFEQDAAHEDGQAVFFDADQDGNLDLYVASGGYAFPPGDPRYQDRLYKGDGQGRFTKTANQLPTLQHNSTCVAAQDVDSDGDTDLFVGGGALPGAYPKGDLSVLLINENGKFKHLANALPRQGELGPINDAEWVHTSSNLELILAGEWLPITVLRQNGPQFEEYTTVAGLATSAGWWNVITAADLDGDGDQDLVVGNRGQNTFFSATPDQPSHLYAGDFDQNGSIDALPFYPFPDGNTYPKHVLDEVFAQYPGIRRKFTRYAPYSRATLDSIFSPAELANTLHCTAHTFATSWFERKEDGSYQVHSLPKPAQFSEVHGILARDLNQDGYLDLLLTGNNYGVDVTTGRADASQGCVLLGNGKGEFTPLNSRESGFFAGGHTRGVYPLDGERMVVLRNGQAPLFFSNAKP